MRERCWSFPWMSWSWDTAPAVSHTGAIRCWRHPFSWNRGTRKPLKMCIRDRGIYVSAYVAGTGDMMDKIIEEVDRTELNAVVIDGKDDQGRITYACLLYTSRHWARQDFRALSP